MFRKGRGCEGFLERAERDYIIERYYRDTGEAEWDTDAIWDWLNDRYCQYCAHSAYEDDDCEFNVLTCPVIQRKMKGGAVG